MAKLTHLFHVGQKVKYLDNEFDTVNPKYLDGIVTDVCEDHIVVDIDGFGNGLWFIDGVNMDMIYPDYNF